jgi:4'-phosphopantetheinyl transferase
MYTLNAPHGQLELRSGEIHLWRVDLDRNMNALTALQQTLAPEELAKAGQFRFELDRNRYTVAHGALRTILACYLQTTPCDPVFRYSPQGKPELAGGGVRFNMSHSYDLALCAISHTRVGIDVERVGDGDDEEVVRCFSPRGLRFLEALPQPARRRAFFRGWTRKEAYSKARGEGLKSGLHNFEVFLNPSDPVLLPALGEARGQRPCWLHDFTPRKGYVGAVAAPRGKRKLRYWKWQAHERPLEANLCPAGQPGAVVQLRSGE